MASNSSDIFSFTCKNFSSNYAPVFQEMKKSGKLCDIDIKVKNQTISAHQVILAGVIPYFYKTLCDKKLEFKYNREIDMEEFDPVVIEALVNYCYSGNMQIKSENIENLMICANLFEMDEIWDACVEFVRSNLNLKNAIKFKRQGEMINCESLIEIMNIFITKNISQTILSDIFVDFEFEEVITIIEKVKSNVSPAENVYEAAMKWVKHSEDERAENLPEILRKFKLSRFSSKFLFDVVSKERLIRESITCRDILDEAKSYHLALKTKESSMISTEKPQISRNLHASTQNDTMPQKTSSQPQSLKEVIYVVGGADVGSGQLMKDSIYVYKQRKWSKVVNFNVRNKRFNVAHSNGKVYFIGCRIDGDNSLLICNLQKEEWSKGIGMIEDRSDFGVATLNDHIYVCGGEPCGNFLANAFKSFRSVECYSIARGVWTPVSPLNTAKKSCVAVAVSGFIYALDLKDRSNDWEIYCPNENEWAIMQPTQILRVLFGAAGLNGKLYVCGGYKGLGTAINSCEVYDPETDSWSFIAPMNQPRIEFTLNACNGKLYAIGGSVFTLDLSSVEEYCPETNEWTFVTPLPDTARYLKSVTVPI